MPEGGEKSIKTKVARHEDEEDRGRGRKGGGKGGKGGKGDVKARKERVHHEREWDDRDRDWDRGDRDRDSFHRGGRDRRGYREFPEERIREKRGDRYYEDRDDRNYDFSYDFSFRPREREEQGREVKVKVAHDGHGRREEHNRSGDRRGYHDTMHSHQAIEERVIAANRARQDEQTHHRREPPGVYPPPEPVRAPIPDIHEHDTMVRIMGEDGCMVRIETGPKELVLFIEDTDVEVRKRTVKEVKFNGNRIQFLCHEANWYLTLPDEYKPHLASLQAKIATMTLKKKSEPDHAEKPPSAPMHQPPIPPPAPPHVTPPTSMLPQTNHPSAFNTQSKGLPSPQRGAVLPTAPLPGAPGMGLGAPPGMGLPGMPGMPSGLPASSLAMLSKMGMAPPTPPVSFPTATPSNPYPWMPPGGLPPSSAGDWPRPAAQGTLPMRNPAAPLGGMPAQQLLGQKVPGAMGPGQRIPASGGLPASQLSALGAKPGAGVPGMMGMGVGSLPMGMGMGMGPLSMGMGNKPGMMPPMGMGGMMGVPGMMGMGSAKPPQSLPQTMAAMQQLPRKSEPKVSTSFSTPAAQTARPMVGGLEKPFFSQNLHGKPVSSEAGSAIMYDVGGCCFFTDKQTHPAQGNLGAGGPAGRAGGEKKSEYKYVQTKSGGTMLVCDDSAPGGNKGSGANPVMYEKDGTTYFKNQAEKDDASKGEAKEKPESGS